MESPFENHLILSLLFDKTQKRVGYVQCIVLSRT